MDKSFFLNLIVIEFLFIKLKKNDKLRKGIIDLKIRRYKKILKIIN